MLRLQKLEKQNLEEREAIIKLLKEKEAQVEALLANEAAFEEAQTELRLLKEKEVQARMILKKSEEDFEEIEEDQQS